MAHLFSPPRLDYKKLMCLHAMDSTKSFYNRIDRNETFLYNKCISVFINEGSALEMERQKSEQHKKRKLFVKALCMVLTLLLMVGIAFSAAILVHETDDLSVSASAGKSAYDLAVQNGYSGDLEQWLMSLAGETGPEGKVGKSAYDLAVEKGYTGTVEECSVL